jgi:hypothetical protein
MNAAAGAGHEGGSILGRLLNTVESALTGSHGSGTSSAGKATPATAMSAPPDKSAVPGKAKSQANGALKKTGRAASKSASSDAASVAVDIGWTMAVLFGQQLGLQHMDDRLPTEHELPPDQRIQLEVRRVNSLLARLAALLPKRAALIPGVPQIDVTAYAKPAPAAPGKGAEGDAGEPVSGTSKQSLEQKNLEILEWLACAGREFSLAYQLGRSIRDTANPPVRTTEPDSSAANWATVSTQAVEANEAAAALRGTTLTDSDKARIKSTVYGQEQRVSAQISARQRLITPRAKAIRNTRAKAKAAGAHLAKGAEGPEDQAQRESDELDALVSQLSRPRVTKLQEWLVALAPVLPADSAAIVSASLGRWCDLVSTVFGRDTPGRLRGYRSPSQWFAQPSWPDTRFKLPSPLEVGAELRNNLLPQGDAWLNLLVGAESPEGLLTPEGYVAAGEAALSRTVRIIRKIVYHYWFAFLILAAAVGGALYFAASDLSGASKLWTQFAAVAGALGITTRGIGSTIARMSKDAESPIFGLERIDAMAWAITTFPADLKLDNRGVRALRRSGILRSSPLGRA